MRKNRKELAITLIELPATVDGTLDGKLAKDVYSLLDFPARGIPLLTAIVKAAGYANTVAINPKYNRRTKGHLDRGDWARLLSSDIVGISVITRTAPQSLELARLLKEANPRIVVVFGGPHPTALPQEALQYGDVVVRHEGDYTFPELLERYCEHFERPHLEDVRGIAYRTSEGEVRLTPDRPFLTSEQLSALPFPEYTENERRFVTHLVVNTARGCPFECEYCSVIDNFGRQFRFLDDEAAIALIRYTLGVKRCPIFFGDDIFNANRARVKRLLDRLLREGIRIPRWFAQVRVEAANDPELLRLMARSGCACVFIGLESVNDETLRLYHKHSTLEKNRAAIETFHRVGIRVHGMFVLGSDADTVETIEQTLRFAKEMNLDTAQFFALTPVPGPPLTARLEREGKIIAPKRWHLYDAQHAVIWPAKMTAYELQMGTIRASLDFYSYREAWRHLKERRSLFNFLIRIKGRKLARQIVRDSAPYLAALRRLEEWRRQIEKAHVEWSERMKHVVEDEHLGAEEKEARLRQLLEEVVARIRADADLFAAGFGPYVQPFADRLCEKLRREFEALVGVGRLSGETAIAGEPAVQ
ncbi:MAG: B12-binding domain-containing radical SAM protein [Blastocatellia bacterium]|nr:B12-binding domain-containing radical SAM protein [Blastocatellia bacterium]MCS7157201.1 B12-binding domain-containing radical SAM protein [Blastocatellia bacterium]MCX7752336.1 B12-binding domain-containing radical SAM protein [Blastocatellia bacterium]MDW8167217.1 radical SAM protein [Acidobacteriota bacterium]